MPTYVYKCDSCGAQFEQVQSFKDAPLTICPSCSGHVRRVFQPVGIVFKGSGWYITDSRKSDSASPSMDSNHSSAEKPAPAADTASAPAETKSSTTAESKPSSSAASDSKPSSASV